MRLGYVGYCHLGTARGWGSTLKECETQAQDFIQKMPGYMIRKGLFIYELGSKRKFHKRVDKMLPSAILDISFKQNQ